MSNAVSIIKKAGEIPCWTEHKSLVISALALMLLAAAAAAAPLLSPFDPLEIHLHQVRQSPGAEHVFGTDVIGRDIFSRVLYGCRASLIIGLCTTVISMGIGLGAGLVAGYFGGKADTAMTVVIDLFLAFPSLLLAIGISVLMPPGLLSVIVALCAVGWASFARLFRGIVYSVKEEDFVDAARAVGCTPVRIIFFHILPHCLPVALIAASLKVGSFILAESALSFLGLGIQPPEPTLGAMVSLNRNYLPSAPWMVLFPGGTIALIVFLCNMVGDSVRDFLDPTLRV